MANEPERPIERLLRAAAKKRRDEAGAPFELHPATRRLLQGEVARKVARAGRQSRSFFQGLGQLWPRFAWGVAIFAVLAVAGYMLLPIPGRGKPEALLARNEPTSPATPAKQPPLPPPTEVAAAPPPPAPAVEANPPAVALAETAPSARTQLARQLGDQRPSPSKDSFAARTDHEAEKKLALAAAPASPAPVTIAPAAPSVVAADGSTKLTGDQAFQSGLARESLAAGALADRPQSSPVAVDGSVQLFGNARKGDSGVGVTQWFAQVAPGPNAKDRFTDKARPAHAVLASFQVEQAGRELRIVDGDGSVYSGYVQIADDARRQRSAKAEAPAAAAGSMALRKTLEGRPAARFNSDQSAAQTYFFRVAGTNRSLNKTVVFTGNLMAATNWAGFQAVTNGLGAGGSLNAFQNRSAWPDLLPLRNSRVSGKVVGGNGKPVEINALPTSP
jgi:hypothetical protein